MFFLLLLGLFINLIMIPGDDSHPSSNHPLNNPFFVAGYHCNSTTVVEGGAAYFASDGTITLPPPNFVVIPSELPGPYPPSTTCSVTFKPVLGKWDFFGAYERREIEIFPFYLF